MMLPGQKHTVEFREYIFSLRGTKSAGRIAEEFGLTRNAVIGLWTRERERRGTAPLFARPRMSEEERRARRAARRRARCGCAIKHSSKLTRSAWALVKAAAAMPINDGAGVSFADHRAGTCWWPLGELTEPAKAFCGDKCFVGKPYCAAHCQLAYKPLDERER